MQWKTKKHGSLKNWDRKFLLKCWTKKSKQGKINCEINILFNKKQIFDQKTLALCEQTDLFLNISRLDHMDITIKLFLKYTVRKIVRKR